MLVRLLCQRVSERNNWNAGEIIDVPDREGDVLIARKHAELVVPAKQQPEQATNEPKHKRKYERRKR